MRVTQRSTVRNYMRNLNRNISNLNNSTGKLSTMRKFEKVSDNTTSAAKAFKVREQLYKNEQYKSNIDEVRNELYAAENNLMNINDILKTVKEKVIQGINGTYTEESRDILANEISNLKEQIVMNLNSKYGDKYLFGGSNNDSAAFTVSPNGKLMFNGMALENIEKDPTTGKPSISNGAVPPVYTPISENKDMYVDMGLGMVMDGDSVDIKTAVKVSVSPLDIVGYGTETKDGLTMPNNIYDILTSMETNLRENDMDDMPALLDQFDDISIDYLTNLTDLGSRTQFLDQTSSKLDSDIFSLQQEQNQLEGLDVAAESMNNKMFEMSWMVSLQIGSKILPPSIFDFMR